MADYSVDTQWSQRAANPAQPTGLTQASEQWMTGKWTPPETAMGDTKAWYGGRNLRGSANGWDNDFYNRAMTQYEDYSDRAIKSGKQSAFFDWLDPVKNPTATGVSLWDDESKGIKRGDVWDNGVKKENLYVVHDENTADTMLGAFLFDGRKQASMNKTPHPERAWRQEVQRETDRYTDGAKYALSAEDFNADTDQYQEDFQDWQGAAAVGTGAAGGAAIGAGIGSIVPGLGTLVGGIAGGIIGGIGGGFAGWLNQDQFGETVARSRATVDRARSEVGGWESKFAWLEGAGRTAMFALQPFQNTVQGLYDGKTGDLRSEWYEPEDPTRQHGFGWEALNLGGALADAVGTFSNPAAVTAYMGTMGATTLGRGGIMVAGDSVFDERTGQYHQLEGAKEYRGAWGALGIDLVQMTQAGALTRSANAATRVFGTEAKAAEAAAGGARGGAARDLVDASRTFAPIDKKADQAWALMRGKRDLFDPKKPGPTADPKMSQTLNGVKFFRDSEGVVLGSRLTTQIAAPSEFVKWVPTGWRARQMRALDEGATGTDDLYRAAMQLTDSGSVLGSAVLNGYAESVEELTQGYLEPHATGNSATWQDLSRAALYGAASGFGMGLGRLSTGPSNEQKQSERARALHIMRTGEGVTQADWKKRWATMSTSERSRLSVANPEETPRIKAMFDTMEQRMTMDDSMQSPFNHMAAQDMLKNAHERDLKNPRNDNTLRLGGMTSDVLPLPDGTVDDARYSADSAVMSSWDVVDVIRRRTLGFIAQRDELQKLLLDATQEKTAATEAKDQVRIDKADARIKELKQRETDTAEQVEMAEMVQKAVLDLYIQYRDETNTDKAKALNDAINNLLDSAWNRTWSGGQTLTPHQQEMVRRAVEFQTTRHPLIDKGSFSILRLRSSLGLSRYGTRSTVYTHQSLLKTIGGDHDGDTRVTLNFMYLEPNALRDLRIGEYASEAEVRPTDSQQLLGIRHEKKWVLQADRPDGEASYLSLFGRWSHDPTSAQSEIVGDGIARLKTIVLNAYSKAKDPANAFEEDVLVDLLNDLEDGIRAGVADSAVKFTEALINSSPQAYADLKLTGERHNRMEIPWLMQQFNVTWDEITVKVSNYNYTLRGQVTRSPAQQQKDIAYMFGKAARRAVGLSYDMDMVFGQDPVRGSQHTHYTSFLHAAVALNGMDATGFVPEVGRELAKSYMQLGSGQLSSDLDAVRDRDRIERRTLDWLEQMTAQVPEVKDKPHMMMVLASTAVRDVDIDPDSGLIDIHDGQITLLQLLMRRSLQIEKAYAAAAPFDDPIHAKIRRLEGMTKAQGPSSYSASQAMLEIFGGFQVEQLLGEGAAPLGSNLTLNQLVKYYTGMNADDRNDRFKNLRGPAAGYMRLKDDDGKKKDPPYSAKVYQQGLMNGYSVLVDALRAVTNNAFKNMEAVDAQSIKDLENGFESWQTVLKEWRKVYGMRRPDGQQVSDEALLDDFLRNAPPRFSRMLLDLMPEASRLGTFQIGENGRVYTAQWVKDVLLEKNAKTAAKDYWLYSKLDAWRAMQGTQPDQEDEDGNVTVNGVRFGRIKSRFLQSLYHVAADPKGLDLQAFMMNAHKAADIQSLIDGINANPQWTGHKEKLLAFHDDVALFESDPKDLWSANLPGSLQREAIQGWGTKIGDYGREAVRAATNRTVEKSLLESMDQVLRTLPNQELPPEKSKATTVTSGQVQDLGLQNLYLLQSAILNRQQFPDGIGPNAREQYFKAIQEGLVQMHNKGTADRRVAPVGEATVLTEAFGVKQGIARELDQVAFLSLQDVLSNPTGLVDGPVRVMMPDGTWTDLDFSTVRGALTHLMDPRTNALAKAVLAPVVRDVNPANVVQMYLDVEDTTDFTKILQDQTFVSLLWSGPRPTLDEANRYIDTIESYTRKAAVKGNAEERRRATFPIINMIDDFLVNYEQGVFTSARDRDKLRNDLIIDVAVAIRTVSKVAVDKRKELGDVISAALYERVFGSGAVAEALAPKFEKTLVNAELRIILQDLYESRAIEILVALDDPTLAPQRKTDLEAEFDELTGLQEQVDKTDDLLSLLPSREKRSFFKIRDFYKVEHGTASADMQKKSLVALLGTKSRLNRVRDKSTVSLIEKVRSIAYNTPQAVYNMQAITEAEWDVLGDWAAELTLIESTVLAGSGMAIPPDVLAKKDPGDVSVARYFDKTGGYLMEPLFDPGILAAAEVIREKAGDPPSSITSAKAANQILDTLFHENKMGVWNEFVPIESLKRRKALETSPTGLAIPTAGIDPVAYADMVGAAMLTTKLPDEATALSRTTISSPDALNFTLRDYLNNDPMLFVKLQNHFVKSVKIRSTSAKFNAAHPNPDITADVTNNNIQTKEVEGSPYRVLHIDELQRMLDAWQKDDGLSNYEIDIEYIDVDKKPFTLEYANNIYFDGVGRASAAATSRGPIPAMIFALMGISKMGQQQPLDAATKGGVAYKPYVPSKLDGAGGIAEIEKTSGSITEYMSRKALHMWGIEYDTGHLLASDLPALYKMVKMRHVVRVKDAVTGQMVLKWPEELIAQEAATGKPTVMTEVEVIGLSEDVSRALYGASGFEAIDTALNQPILNLQDMDKFPSLLPERLARLGLSRLGQHVEPGQTQLAQAVLPGRAMKSDMAGARPKNLWEARETRWRKHMGETLVTRSIKSKEGVTNFNPRNISTEGKKAFAEMLAAERNTSLFTRIGIPMASLQDLTRTQIAEVLLQRLEKLLPGQSSVIWQHVQDGLPNFAHGLLTKETIDDEFSKTEGIGPTYGDIVVVDLSSILRTVYGKELEAFDVAKRVIKAYAERGVTVVLGSPQGDQMFRGRVASWMREGEVGYEPLSNSTHIFQPITSTSMVSRNQRALASMNTAVEVINPRYATLGLISNFFPGTDENNTYYDIDYDPQWKRTSAVIIPASYVITDTNRDKEHLFNLPTGKQKDMVAKKLRDLMKTPEGKDMLIKLAQNETGDPDAPNTPKYRVNDNGTIDPGIRSFEDALNVLEQQLIAGKWPIEENNELMVGDLIPVVDQSNNILLQRHGYAIIDKHLLTSQLATATAKDQPAANIAVAPPKLEDGQTVTPPLKITRFYPDPRRGWVVEGEWVLDRLSKLIWEGTGFKAGGALIPDNWILPPPMSSQQLNRTTITQFTSVKAVFGKGAVQGVVDNFRDAFVVFGIELRPYVVDFFFGKDPGRTDDQQDALWSDAQLILEAWSNLNHGLDDQAVATLLDANTIQRYARENLHNIISQLGIQVPHTDLSSKSNGSAEQELMTVLFATLAAPGVQLEHVISTSGLLTVTNSMDPDKKVIKMPTIFTDALDDASSWPALRKELFVNMNSHLPPGYFLDEQWHFHVDIGLDGRGENGGVAVFTPEESYLQYILPAPASENPAGYTQSGIGRTQQQTQHVTNVINAAVGGRIAIDPGMTIDKETGEKKFRTTNIDTLYKNDIMRFEPGSVDKFYNLLTRIDPKDDSYSPWVRDLPSQHIYRGLVRDKRAQYRQRINRSDDVTWGDTRVTRANAKADELLRELGLEKYLPAMRGEVDFLVRQFAGRPGPSSDQPDYVGDISGELYIQIVDLMLTNVRDFMNPLHGGVVFILDRHFAQTIYNAQQDKPVGLRWSPMTKDGKTRRRAGEWEEWIDALLGHYQNSNQEFLSMFLTDIDGFFHTWHDARPGLGDLPVSYARMRNLQLMNAKVNDAVLSLDPGREAVLHDPIILDSMQRTLDLYIGHEPTFNAQNAKGAYDSDLADQLSKQRQWLASKKLPKQKRTKAKDYMREGTFYRTSVEYENQFMKNLVNLSLTMRLANPALWVSALMEVPARNMLEHITNVITGSNISGGSKLAAMTSRYDQAQVTKLKNLAKQMGQRKEWLAVLYDEMAYNNLVEGTDSTGKISRGLEKTASFTARATSDPKFGMTGTAVASRYIEAALEYLALSGSSITVEQFVSEMSKDPLWLRRQYEESADRGQFTPHISGMNRVGQVRSQKQTMVADILMSPIDKMCASSSGLLNISGHLLRIPFMFTRFNINALLTVSGLTAWDQAAAMFFDGKKKPAFMRKAGQPETWDLRDIIETIDLQRTFIRSGVTYSMLMTLGMMAGNMGLGGDDEEERRRKRLMQNMNLPIYLDPADSANSFTNADAVYLDGIPFLGRFFDRPTGGVDENGNPIEGESIVIPHWITKQFTSPIIGMQRFFESGDLREIGWGFWDAFSAIPNSAKRLWDEADVTANLLGQQAAEEANKGTSLGAANSSSLIVQIVGVYERALFENSFANTLRSASDKYDRNPYLIPGVDPATGEILRQPGTGLPIPQKDALVSYINEDGDVQQAYMTRQGKDGALHQYAENNLTFALVASLFDGQGDSSFLRKNMAPRQQEIQVDDKSLAEFEAFVMSAYQGSGGQQSLTQEEIIQSLKQRDSAAGVWWDQEAIEAEAEAIYESQPHEVGALSILSPEGREVITLAGHDSVFTSLANGALKIGDPALNGYAADQEMRDSLAALWGERLVQEGLDLNLGFEQANYRARRLWYGDNTHPEVPGLREIIYDKKIPRENDLVYNQLNMTYAIGPDGKPWATPFPKQGLLQALGLPIPTGVLAPGSGMMIDEQGRIIDLTVGENGLNTGLSGLERVVDVNDIEIPEDDPFEKGAAKADSGSSGKKFGRTPWRSYGGGGGGGGYTPQMRALPGGAAARFDGIQMINTSNPILRRADVYRQRIWSERGRLKQWQ